MPSGVRAWLGKAPIQHAPSDLRLVLDSNVAVSALLWRGKPYQLLSTIRQHLDTLHLISSEPLLLELADVLRRPHLSERLGVIGQSPDAVLADYAAAIMALVEPAAIAPVCRDPDDDAILAAAVSGNVDLIVSGDGDLLSLGEYAGIPIVSASKALDLIMAQLKDISV